jgi:serine phosphatase RsbU (regulator of sigma subunit)
MEVWGGNRSVDSDFQMPGLRIWLHSKAHGGSSHGGDVYYLSSCASGRITRILLADVSGHGDSVAATAARLRDLMRKNINRISQSQFVARMNDCFKQVAGPSEVFATAIVSTFFAPTKTLTICVAGHPSPLVWRQKIGAWSVFAPARGRSFHLADLPLGVADDVRYSEHRIPLERGDRVLLYTDGLTDAVNRSGQHLDAEQLCALAGEMDAADSTKFLPRLLQRIEGPGGYRLDGDDVTVVQIEATDTTVSLKNNLLAPVRIVRSLFGSPR